MSYNNSKAKNLEEVELLNELNDISKEIIHYTKEYGRAIKYGYNNAQIYTLKQLRYLEKERDRVEERLSILRDEDIEK